LAFHWRPSVDAPPERNTNNNALQLFGNLELDNVAVS